MTGDGNDRLRPQCFNPECDKSFDSVNEMVAVEGRGERCARHFCEGCAERILRGPPMTDGGQVEDDIERAFVDEDEPEEPDDSNDRPVGPLLYLEDGTPVRVRAMDKNGEFLTYQGSPEQGFYVFEGSGEQATVALDPDRSVEAAIERFFELPNRDGWNLSKSALNRRLNKALRLADELDEDSTMPHGLRATAASLMAGQNVDSLTLKSVLGWADLQTAQHYLADSPDRAERALHRVRTV